MSLNEKEDESCKLSAPACGICKRNATRLIGHHDLDGSAPGEPAPEINDVFVDADKLIYLTDRRRGGMYIVEYTGEV